MAHRVAGREAGGLAWALNRVTGNKGTLERGAQGCSAGSVRYESQVEKPKGRRVLGGQW